LNDSPVGYGTVTSVLLSNGSNAFTYYDIDTKADADGDTFTNTTIDAGSLANLTTNLGTIEGGVIQEVTMKDYGETSQTPTSSSSSLAIDLANGNVVNYIAIENTVLTLTTTHSNTSFTMIATNLGAFTFDWDTNQTVLWEGGIEPTWSVSGNDLITFTKIGSTWIGGALIGVA